MASAVRPVRAAKACVICHKKKIKCDLDFTEGFQCSPCIRDGYECRPRERKRKRTYTLDSESPPPKIRRESTLLSPNSGASLAGGTKLAPNLSTAEASYQASSSANGAFSQPAAPVYAGFSVTSHDDASETTNATPGAGPSSARPGVGYTTTNASYLGRSEYIEAINDEEEAPPHSTRGLSAQDLEILKIQGAFEMPIRAYRESLIDHFWTRCWPWTPIVERNWIEGRPQNAISILLLQGMMLAGSRVSSSPVTYGPPEDFYKKGKMLFWMGAERDPMLMCVAVHTAEQDLQIVIKSQEELGKRWPSAIGSLKRITDVRDKVTKSQRSTYFPENNLTPEQMQFFDSFGADVCRSWDVLYHNSDTQHQPSAARDIVTAGILQELRTPGGLYAESLQEGPGIDGSNTMGLDAQLLDGPVSLDQYGGIGNWLFNDWEHGNGAFW